MQTLYLKKYYPVQFYTSLLNHAKNDPDWLSSAIMAAFFKNINILPPNRKSKWEYTMLDENTILMGFSSINGMGDIAYQEFQDIDISNITKDTFFTYQFKKFNKGNFEACLSAGVFDDWSDSREELLELRKNKMKKNTMQLDLFGQNSFDIFEESIKGKFEPTSELEKYKDFLKVCALDLKLFDKVSKLKKEFYDKYNILIESVINFESPNNFYYFVLKNMIQKTSKNGKQFWSLELSDGCSSVNLILWQDGHDRLKEKLEIGGVYVTKFSKDKNWLKFQDGSQFMKVF
jgi:DNA polymerase-3 subunit alpha